MTTAIDTPQTDADANQSADRPEPAPGGGTAGSEPVATPSAALESGAGAQLAIVAEPALEARSEPNAAQQAESGAALSADPPAVASEPQLGPTPTPTPTPTSHAAAAPADCGPLLKKTFPALFAGGPKPLKLRIQVDIQERAPGVFSKQALAAFFRRYTGSTSYLIAVSRAKTRFDLDGAAAGELSEEHRKIALDELARRRGNQESRAALEEQQRRNRATLLHDFERTTLTPANFCALKGIGVDELDGYLATARREAVERPQNPRAFDDGQESRRPPSQRQPPSRPDRLPAEAGRPPQRRR